jgi:cytochrome c biogenesis protein CcmG/thiol:disulfide interchange protein DsbE
MKRKFLLLSLLLALAGTVSAQLPSVTIKDLQGKNVDTSKLNNGGKPFIIDFWATWCKPCQRELKAINEVYEEWQKATGVKLFAISIDQAQNIAKVKPLVDGFGWEYEVLCDPNGDFQRALNIKLIPHLIICDGNGKIVKSHSGYTDGSEAEIFKELKEIAGTQTQGK